MLKIFTSIQSELMYLFPPIADSNYTLAFDVIAR